VLEWHDVSVEYDVAEPSTPPRPVLDGIDLRVHEAELVLLAGHTGSGKSTLLRTVNGLVPRFTGGRVSGEVVVAGQRVRDSAPRDLAHLVGYVGQDPAGTFVTSRVEDELAYGMEQLGLAPGTMRRRVEETLDLLGLADLREHGLRSLSGGQQQRVAIGAVLTMHPQVLVLDEPTSALDPTAAEEVLGTVTRLVEDLGLTVMVAEHRLERVVPFADRMVVLEAGRARVGAPEEMLSESPVAPPIVELGRLARWHPLPLTVRHARRHAVLLRDAIARGVEPAGAGTRTPPGAAMDRRRVLAARDLTVTYGRTPALTDVSLDLHAGEIAVVMGRNGSGKSSLLWALQGTGRRDGGTVDVLGHDPSRLSPGASRRLVGLVPQTATDLLYLETVADECAAADRQSEVAGGTCRRLLDRMAPGVGETTHPRDLSEGQQLALVLAVVLTAEPPVLLLDEPTRGLDYAGKRALSEALRAATGRGTAVAVVTHDVEFAAGVADRAVVLARGEVVSSGPAVEVLSQSPAFAPQVTKVLGTPWLTVAQVRGALDVLTSGDAAVEALGTAVEEQQ
jgi:energy-coupling factor transport system ATP-binding protein